MSRYLLSLLLLISFTTLAADYYAGTERLEGDPLRTKLHQIIDGQKPLKYTQKGNVNWLDGKNMDVWEALIYTDSACPDDNPKCGLVTMLYLGDVRSIEQANGGKGKNDSWDREHVWPKSRGFSKQSQDGYTDLHHLRPADRNLNGAHSNYGYDMGGTPFYDTLANGTKVISGAYVDKKNESFEPPNRAKAQIARMVFYMAIRYEKGDNHSPENMPDLRILDRNEKQSGQPTIGDLCTLLAWNDQFPVSDFEKRRNDRVQELQGNRNPFIDHPRFADLIWSKQCSS